VYSVGQREITNGWEPIQNASLRLPQQRRLLWRAIHSSWNRLVCITSNTTGVSSNPNLTLFNLWNNFLIIALDIPSLRAIMYVGFEESVTKHNMIKRNQIPLSGSSYSLFLTFFRHLFIDPYRVVDYGCKSFYCFCINMGCRKLVVWFNVLLHGVGGGITNYHFFLQNRNSLAID